jgi:hypothetical protein
VKRFAIYFVLSLVATKIYAAMLSPAFAELERSWHPAMIGKTALAPGQYRILAFLIPEAFIALGLDTVSAYLLQQFIFIFVAACVFHVYLRSWFDDDRAMIGSLLILAAYPVTCMPYIQPASALNFVVFIAGFLLIERRMDKWLPPLMVVGTLNNETTVLLIAAYFISKLGRERGRVVLLKSLLLLMVWLVTVAALRLYFGWRPFFTEFVQLPNNVAGFKAIRGVFDWYLGPFYVFGALWVLALIHLHKKPSFLRRQLWFCVLFLAVHFVFARMEEVRLFLPLAPVIVPLGLMSVVERGRTSTSGKPVQSGRE